MHFGNDNHHFSFSFDSNDGETHLEMDCKGLYIGEILNKFQDFLRGCGYEVDGMIEVIPFDDDTKFDFTNIPNNNWPFGEKKRDDIAYTNPIHPSEK